MSVDLPSSTLPQVLKRRMSVPSSWEIGLIMGWPAAQKYPAFLRSSMAASEDLSSAREPRSVTRAAAIEQDIDMSGEITEEAFQQYLKERDIDFPDLDSAIPECAKNLMRKEYRSSLALLRKHRGGRYAEWIEPLLTMDAVKQ